MNQKFNALILINQEPRGKPTRYELENTFKKLRGKPRGIKPSEGIKKMFLAKSAKRTKT